MTAAKRAGYIVTAIDAFADQHTVELADITMVVDYDQHGFNADALLRAISKLDVSQYLGCVYGSGFEAQPELLQKIAGIMPLLGNTAETVRAVKTSFDFFAALTQCHIAHPDVYDALPDVSHADGYLRKFAGGCGGSHITVASSEDAELGINQYYQQRVAGRSVSLLFIADSQNIAVVGFNEQWLSPAAVTQFRYGGAVSRINLAPAIQLQLIDAAHKLTRTFGLLGLNSLDAVVQDGIAYVLEINPRLSATIDLYDDLYDVDMNPADLPEKEETNLLDWHVKLSLEKQKLGHGPHMSRAFKPCKAKPCKAHAIVYATADIAIAARFEWPSWVTDNPCPDTQHETIGIFAGQPVCSVLAYAEFADEARQLAQARVKIMQQLLQKI